MIRRVSDLVHAANVFGAEKEIYAARTKAPNNVPDRQCVKQLVLATGDTSHITNWAHVNFDHISYQKSEFERQVLLAEIENPGIEASVILAYVKEYGYNGERQDV